mgnify:FL=1|jgi:hypothetical protein
MILSKGSSDGAVVAWHLTELLDAGKRAKFFSDAVESDSKEPNDKFEKSTWAQTDDVSSLKPLLSPEILVEDVKLEQEILEKFPETTITQLPDAVPTKQDTSEVVAVSAEHDQRAAFLESDAVELSSGLLKIDEHSSELGNALESEAVEFENQDEDLDEASEIGSSTLREPELSETSECPPELLQESDPLHRLNQCQDLIRRVESRLSDIQPLWLQLSELTLAVASSVVRTSFEKDRGALSLFYKEILAESGFEDGVPLVLYVSPEIETWFTEERLKFDDSGLMTLRADASLELGDLRVEYDNLVVERILALDFSEAHERIRELLMDDD